MALLLDTHVVLWLEEAPIRIPEQTRARIFNDTALFISITSFWEIAIKTGIGKLSISKPLSTFAQEFLHDYDAELLPCRLTDIYRVQHLPLHHRDPFDRLIIAQSLVEGLSIGPSDAQFDAYGVKRIW